MRHHHLQNKRTVPDGPFSRNPIRKMLPNSHHTRPQNHSRCIASLGRCKFDGPNTSSTASTRSRVHLVTNWLSIHIQLPATSDIHRPKSQGKFTTLDGRIYAYIYIYMLHLHVSIYTKYNMGLSRICFGRLGGAFRRWMKLRQDDGRTLQATLHVKRAPLQYNNAWHFRVLFKAVSVVALARLKTEKSERKLMWKKLCTQHITRDNLRSNHVLSARFSQQGTFRCKKHSRENRSSVCLCVNVRPFAKDGTALMGASCE